MRDDVIGSKPLKNETGIVNLDRGSGPGTHWCAYIKNNKKVLWFDSFGDLPPPLEIQKYFDGCKIFYNHLRYQAFDSYICGHLCLQFLVENIQCVREHLP
jgi:hypothetical protein